MHFSEERPPGFNQIPKVLHDPTKIMNRSCVPCASRHRKWVWRIRAQGRKVPKAGTAWSSSLALHSGRFPEK